MHFLITFLMTLVMFAGLMLVFRRPLLWYLRINERIENQRQIIELLKSIDSKSDKARPQAPSLRHNRHHRQAQRPKNDENIPQDSDSQ